MGVIQNAVNQMLGTAAMAARLAPGYEERYELRKLGKQEQAIAKQEEVATISGKEALNTGVQEKMLALKQTAADVAERKFQLQPTAENFEAMVKKASGVGSMRSVYNVFNKAKQRKMDEAMQNVAAKQEAAQNQKRNFMNYLRNEPIAGGGKVGDLPINVQKQIASTYSKADRKKLMDRGDSK